MVFAIWFIQLIPDFEIPTRSFNLHFSPSKISNTHSYKVSLTEHKLQKPPHISSAQSVTPQIRLHFYLFLLLCVKLLFTWCRAIYLVVRLSNYQSLPIWIQITSHSSIFESCIGLSAAYFKMKKKVNKSVLCRCKYLCVFIVIFVIFEQWKNR